MISKSQTLDGQAAVGQLVELNDQQVVLQTADGRSTFALAALATLTSKGVAAPEDKKATLWVELVDASGLAATEYTVHGGTAKVTLTGKTTLEIPTRAIRWVRFSPPLDHDAKLARQWSDITETNASGDLLVVRKNGELDYLEGVQGDIDAEICKFELDKELIPVKRPKVEGMVYFHSTAAELAGRDRPVACARRLARVAAQRDARRRRGPGDHAPAAFRRRWPLDQITRFDFTSGKIAYLSDLEPESRQLCAVFRVQGPTCRRWASFIAFRRDESVRAEPAAAWTARPIARGWPCKAARCSRINCRASFALFKAVVGIDDSVRDGGQRALGNQGGRQNAVARATCAAPSRPASWNWSSAACKRLEIVADYGDDLDIGDRLDLAEARVTK